MLNGSTLLKRARRLADDEAEPYYIDDTEMYSYISEAERLLAVHGRWIRDMTTYQIKNEDRWVEIGEDPEVIEFRTAEIINAQGHRWELGLRGTMDIIDDDREVAGTDYGFNSVTYASRTLTTGRPSKLIFGKRQGMFELSPCSNGDYSIEAFRLVYPPPITFCSYPTIPERHHLAIPIGAAVLAMQAAEAEHFSPERVAKLDVGWQRALIRASEESGRIQRDTSVVRFTNNLWS